MILKHKMFNWGPKKFRVLNAWLNEDEFNMFVRKAFVFRSTSMKGI